MTARERPEPSVVRRIGWLPLGLIAFGLVLTVYALFFRRSEEDRIRERLDALAAAVRIDDSELNPLVRHGRIRQAFREIVAKEATVSVAELTELVQGREEIAAAATQTARVYASADVSFGDLELRIAEDGGGAEVTGTATIAGARNGEPFRRDERRVALRLEKIDDEWQFASIKVLPREAPEGE